MQGCAAFRDFTRTSEDPPEEPTTKWIDLNRVDPEDEMVREAAFLAFPFPISLVFIFLPPSF